MELLLLQRERNRDNDWYVALFNNSPTDKMFNSIIMAFDELFHNFSEEIAGSLDIMILVLLMNGGPLNYIHFMRLRTLLDNMPSESSTRRLFINVVNALRNSPPLTEHDEIQALGEENYNRIIANLRFAEQRIDRIVAKAYRFLTTLFEEQPQDRLNKQAALSYLLDFCDLHFELFGRGSALVNSAFRQEMIPVDSAIKSAFFDLGAMRIAGQRVPYYGIGTYLMND